jgi:hypothetical protein
MSATNKNGGKNISKINERENNNKIIKTIKTKHRT